MANDEDAELVPVPHRRQRLLRRLRAADPEAKPVIMGDPVQAVIRVRLAPSAPRCEFEQYVQALACVRCAWQVTGEVDYELLVTCRAIAGLDGALTCLRGCGGTEVTSAGLVLREVVGLGAAGLARQRVRAAGDGSFR